MLTTRSLGYFSLIALLWCLPSDSARDSRVRHNLTIKCAGIFTKAEKKKIFEGSVPALKWDDSLTLCAGHDAPYGGAKNVFDLCDLSYRLKYLKKNPITVLDAELKSSKHIGHCRSNTRTY